MRKCKKCSNEIDIEDQDICGYCATEELFEMQFECDEVREEELDPMRGVEFPFAENH